MKKLLVVLLLLVSGHVAALDDVGAFLSAYEAMDKDGYQVVSDYRLHILSNCSRDVTVREIRLFSTSPMYFKLVSLHTMGIPQVKIYQSTFTEITCEQKI